MTALDPRELLSRAADTGAGSPDTERILARAKALRRRSMIAGISLLAAVAIGGLVGASALLTSDADRSVVARGNNPDRPGQSQSPAGEPQVVEIDTSGEMATVRLLSGRADPQQVERALRGAGIDATVTAEPVAPPLEGLWTGASDERLSGLPGAIDENDKTLVRVPTGTRINLTFGRPARPDETYRVSTSPFLPGGPLHCAGIEKLPPLEAERAINDLGYEVSWRLETTTRVFGGGVSEGRADIVEDPPEGTILTNASEFAPTVMVVFISPSGDPQANQDSIPEQDC